MTPPRVYFMGCIGQVGHHFYPRESTDERGTDGRPRGLPKEWGWVDARLTPPRVGAPGRDLRTDQEEPQGAAALHHLGGWSALSFWDRTVDRRGNSNGTFLVEAPDLTAEQVLDHARRVFPKVVERVGPITVASGA